MRFTVLFIATALTALSASADAQNAPNIFPPPSAGTSGVGAFVSVPAGSTNGTPIGVMPAGAKGVRFYLPSGASVTYTFAAAQPSTAPSLTFTISQSATGPNWDEDLNGQMIYVTAVSGSPLFRWY